MSSLFCINSTPRAGTHLLGAALHTHPDMHVYGEIFHRHHHDGQVFKNETVAQALVRLQRREDAPVIGFCVHRNAVPSVEREIHKRAERQLPSDLQTIIVWRENLFRQFVSLRRAQSIGQWTVVQGQKMPKFKSVSLTMKETIDFFRRMERTNRYPPQRYTHKMRISYEELVDDFQGTIDNVLVFLDVKPMKLEPVTVKTGVPLRKAVQNYVALKRVFKDTPWSKFFDE